MVRGDRFARGLGLAAAKNAPVLLLFLLLVGLVYAMVSLQLGLLQRAPEHLSLPRRGIVAASAASILVLAFVLLRAVRGVSRYASRQRDFDLQSMTRRALELAIVVWVLGVGLPAGSVALSRTALEEWIQVPVQPWASDLDSIGEQVCVHLGLGAGTCGGATAHHLWYGSLQLASVAVLTMMLLAVVGATLAHTCSEAVTRVFCCLALLLELALVVLLFLHMQTYLDGQGRRFWGISAAVALTTALSLAALRRVSDSDLCSGATRFRQDTAGGVPVVHREKDRWFRTPLSDVAGPKLSSLSTSGPSLAVVACVRRGYQTVTGRRTTGLVTAVLDTRTGFSGSPSRALSMERFETLNPFADARFVLGLLWPKCWSQRLDQPVRLLLSMVDAQGSTFLRLRTEARRRPEARRLVHRVAQGCAVLLEGAWRPAPLLSGLFVTLLPAGFSRCKYDEVLSASRTDPLGLLATLRREPDEVFLIHGASVADIPGVEEYIEAVEHELEVTIDLGVSRRTRPGAGPPTVVSGTCTYASGKSCVIILTTASSRPSTRPRRYRRWMRRPHRVASVATGRSVAARALALREVLLDGKAGIDG